jgi:hypothetical protein
VSLPTCSSSIKRPQRADFRQLAALQRVVAKRQVNVDFFDDGAGAGAHDQQPVGHRDGFDQVMGNEQRGFLFIEQHPRHVLLQDHLGLRVEGRKRLVEKQHLRVDGQGASQGRALTHPARQLERVMVGKTLQVATIEQIFGHGLARGGRHTLDFQTQFDVAANTAPWHQQVFLQHERDLTNRTGDRFAADKHFAFGRTVEAGTHIKDGALAATGRANDRHHFTTANLEVDPANGERRFGLSFGRETFTDIAEFNFCGLQIFLGSGFIPLRGDGVHLFHSHWEGSLVCFIGDTVFSA